MSKTEEPRTLNITGSPVTTSIVPLYTIRQSSCFIWKPKEDITAFEIAELLPFITSPSSLQMADRNASYMRHFEIYDPKP